MTIWLAGQVLVDDKVFRDRHLRLGETLPMGFVDTGVTEVPIGGTYKTNQFLGNYVVSYDFAAASRDPAAGSGHIHQDRVRRAV